MTPTQSTLKLSTISIPALEKAMWFSRILKILGPHELTTVQIKRNLSTECERRGLKMLTDNTLGRYLNEMKQRGVVTGDGIPMKDGRSRALYWRKA